MLRNEIVEFVGVKPRGVARIVVNISECAADRTANVFSSSTRVQVDI